MDPTTTLTCTNGREHLLAELRRLDLMLERQVLRLRARHQLVENEYRGLYIPDEQIDALLRQTAAANGTTTTIESLSQQIEAQRTWIDSQVQPHFPLQQLTRLFHLTPAEIDLLLIALAPELDLRYETLYAYVQNDIAKKYPTADLALKLIYDQIEQRLNHPLTSESRLRQHQLLTLVPDAQDTAPSLLAHYLQIEPRIRAFLLQQPQIDKRLRDFTQPYTTDKATLQALPVPPALQQQLQYMADFLSQQNGLIFLVGSDGMCQQTAAALATALGQNLITADLRLIHQAAQPLPQTLKLLQREARLQGAALYLAHHEVLQEKPAALSLFIQALAQLNCSLFVGSTLPWYPIGDWPQLPFFDVTIPLPDFHQRHTLWQQALQPYPLHAEIDMADVANKFALPADQIVEAAHYAVTAVASRPPTQRLLTTDDLNQAARVRSNQALRQLAQKLTPKYRWPDIILPRSIMNQLHEVYNAVKYRHIVYTDWGFAQKLSLGKGLNALFAGESGTGKTMAAEILANELCLDIYKIDLSSVISKYIGETEKNLNRIFESARASNAILFFDEADALFGKRSEVKDARDRYANIEVAYLLQKMEEYDGITILATNLQANMDDAFARRLHHTVEFPFPDAYHRERIWRHVFPPHAPLKDDIDFKFLARQFELAGGNIRNVALSAAFMAAEAGLAISMEQLILGVARELQKLKKLPTKADFREYYALVLEKT